MTANGDEVGRLEASDLSLSLSLSRCDFIQEVSQNATQRAAEEL